MSETLKDLHQPRQNVQPLVYTQFIFILFLVLVMPLRREFNAVNLIYPVCLLLVLHCLWSVWSWKTITNRFFDPYILFLIPATLFNAGYAFLTVSQIHKSIVIPRSFYITNAFNIMFLYKEFGPDTVLKTYYFVLLSFAAFHLGALIAASKQAKATPNDALPPERAQSRSKGLRRAGWLMFFASCIPALIVMKHDMEIARSQGYFATFTQEWATGYGAASRRLADFFVPSLFFLLASVRKRTSGLTVFTLVMMLAYVLGYSYIGSRHNALSAIAAYTWLWHYHIKRIPRGLLVAGVLVIFIMIPVIREARESIEEERFSLDTIQDTLLRVGNPFISTVLEMGSTIQLTAYEVEFMPDQWDFQWGTGYCYALLSAFPNLFWTLHPSAAYENPGHRILRYVRPNFTSVGGGWGSSFITEAYFNFGWFGVVFLAFLGYFCMRMILHALRSRNPLKLAALASFLPYFLFFGRNETRLLVRGFVWYSLAPYILACLLTSFENTYQSRKQ